MIDLGIGIQQERIQPVKARPAPLRWISAKAASEYTPRESSLAQTNFALCSAQVDRYVTIQTDAFDGGGVARASAGRARAAGGCRTRCRPRFHVLRCLINDLNKSDIDRTPDLDQRTANRFRTPTAPVKWPETEGISGQWKLITGEYGSGGETRELLTTPQHTHRPRYAPGDTAGAGCTTPVLRNLISRV
ncbi:hypothetical protein EVAR_19386_1 [Eumeta japonica]|uniref:Uncharacterized protein n=1 Tax=Eumeta variegata TaxID=151549 RepID=A0A4C1TRH0_EUMVA|nr:hypothetical protein EVAR_19386_1 [Eumeta japonica]